MDELELLDTIKQMNEEIKGLKEQVEKLNEPQITKEEIMKEKNTAKRQKLIREHMELFQ